MEATRPDAASHAIARLDRWLDTMRVATRPPGEITGYGGPVVHWWRDSLLFCGPGFDWRYEGIVLGYLGLHRRTREQRWLAKAIRAGDDLVAAQLPSGNYRHSRFESNPGTGGTPHEAAADIGLLALAAELKHREDPAWQSYVVAARRNLEGFYLAHLWDDEAGLFYDDPSHHGFVPNKAATVVEALSRLFDLTGEEEWIGRYVRPTVEAILRCQVRRSGHRLDGAIAQDSSGGSGGGRYLPFYIARCIPAIIDAAKRSGDDRYKSAALAAGAFLLRWRDQDGAFPQVVYSSGRVNRYPRWIAGVGDILRSLELLRPYGLDADLRSTRRWLLDGQLPSGAFRSAEGFGSQVSQRRPTGPPDARDLLPIVGWNDKAFRYLADGVDQVPDHEDDETTMSLRCLFRGRVAELREHRRAIELHDRAGPVHRWDKSATWGEATV
jgi:hypothetical protein